ncbi:hypothetical protein CLV98_102237 [Dyadobacter jejuensis]|uniref:Uncharacterized protein n=1 Tax=Dyadobacter jejuensis TaxID=1082580 RepID=A0A316AQF3_9BACT|nr:hypothetical protein [Dyadobacter jejuensis]PWJ59404.1 hypothetical protein CLV98_102237 [Dyadobacter jejuensis]
MNIKWPCFILLFWCVCKNNAYCQKLEPGLTGRAPSKWITFRHTMSTGTQYRTVGTAAKSFTREEWYIRAWIPIVHRPNFSVVLGPHFRTEQLELKSTGENPVAQFSDWKLRTKGLDMKSIARLSDDSWIITAGNINKSGNLSELPASSVPFNYAFTGVFLKKLSETKEIGGGILISKSNNLNILPVFIFNYNFSPVSGLEIALPRKIALRQNLSPKDIIYVKSEAVTRSYYTYGNNKQAGIFRRIDVDFSVLYNRQFNKLIGMELSAGYRKNISNKVPMDIIPIRSSGLVGTLEFFIKSPFGPKKETHSDTE